MQKQNPIADEQCPSSTPPPFLHCGRGPLKSHELTVDFEAVLEFLRGNGLSECESALLEDIMEKSQMGSSDSVKSFFPTVPPPSPLRIPPTPIDGGESEEGSSDDEFVSLGSSTTELSSSDFTNPYGIRITRTSSQVSSDRLSQFGTARDYPDFDMQNDLFWYKERDEEYGMPPLCGDTDFDDDPSEDKFIMAMQTGQPIEEEEQSKYSLMSQRDLASMENLTYKPCTDYYGLSKNFRIEESDKKREENCNDYSCSAPLCACCNDPADYCLENLQVTDITDLQYIEFNDFEKNSQSNENENSDFNDDKMVAGESRALDEEGGAISDELLIFDTKEDEYEIFNLRIIHRKNRTGFEENKELPIVLNSVIAGRYYVTEFLGSAAFSRVVQAHDLYSGIEVCLKIIKNDKDFLDQSLDEIKLLKFVNKHDPADERHILRLHDYFYHREHLFIVTELLRANLYEFQKYNRESGAEPYFTMQRLQVITKQCLEALLYLHDLGIVHCDLKPENILIKSYSRCEIKVIDLGSSCFQTDNLSLYVQSRSYRAPEVMLGLHYDHKIDIWSLGCVLAELYSGEVLFPNEGIAMILGRMIEMLGPIDMDLLQKGRDTHKYFTNEYDPYQINEDTNQLEYIIPDESSLEDHLHISDSLFVRFLKYLLRINPKRRPTAREALDHPWLSHPYDL